MKNIYRRVIAMLLALIMLSGVIGPDNLMTLVAYADDENGKTVIQSPSTEEIGTLREDSEKAIQPAAAEEDVAASQTSDPTESLMPAASQTPVGTESETEAVVTAEPDTTIEAEKREEKASPAPEAALGRTPESALEDVTIDTLYTQIKIPGGSALNFSPAAIKAEQLTLPEPEGGALTVAEAWSFVGCDEAVARVTLKSVPALKEGETLILAGLSYEWKDKTALDPVGADGCANEKLLFTVNQALYRRSVMPGYWADINSAEYFGFALLIFTPEEQKPISYTFADADDYVMLSQLLRENGVDTVAVDNAYVSEGDESAIELIDYIGDYMVAPNKHFDEIKLTALTREGVSVKITLRYPIRLAEQTLAPALEGEGEMSLSGNLPENATVEVAPVAVEIAGAPAIAAYDIDIYADGESWQPDGEAVTVSLYDPAFTGTLYVYHMADTSSAPEYVAAVTAQDGWISFAARGFSVYAVSETVLEKYLVASDGNTYKITVTYDSTVGIPMQGTELEVSEIVSGDTYYNNYIETSSSMLGVSAESFGLVRLFDISIVAENDHSVVYEPTGSVEVTISLMGTALSDYETVDVLHFKSGADDADTVDSVVNGDAVEFTAEGFSVYAVIGSTIEGEQEYARRWYYFVYENNKPFYFTTDDDGETPINYLIVRNDDYLQNPGIPTDSEGKTFLGWYTMSSGGERIEFIEVDGRQVYGPVTDIGDSDERDPGVTFYAHFADSHTVTYFDESGIIVRTDVVAHGDTVELTRAETDVHYTLYTPENAKDMFLGWAEEAGKSSMKGLPTTLEIVDDVELHPVIAPACWITFYTGPSGSGAEYLGDKHWAKNQTITGSDLPVPTWAGYTFAGWYDSADYDNPIASYDEGKMSIIPGHTGADYTTSDDELHLSDDITLYAKWTEKTDTKYTVIFWAQKNTDEVGLSDANKTYDYLGSVERTAKTGATVTLASGDIRLVYDDVGSIKALGRYFEYNVRKSDASTTVKGDGSSVLNVYFDRKVMTFNFWNSTDKVLATAPYSLDEQYFTYDGQPLLLTYSNGSIRWSYSYYGYDLVAHTVQYNSNNGIYEFKNEPQMTLTGLYGASMTNWPSESAWQFSVNGFEYGLSLPWGRFVITPAPDNNATVWNLWQKASSSGVNIHYMGETFPDYPTLNYTDEQKAAMAQQLLAEGKASSLEEAAQLVYVATEIRPYNDTYYENSTMNPWVYYGGRLDELKNNDINEINKEKNQYYRLTGKEWKDLTASKLEYKNELASDETGIDSLIKPDNKAFEGYELVGYKIVKANGEHIETWNQTDLENALNTGIKMEADYKDVYFYMARVRSTLDIYSQYSDKDKNSYTIPYGLELYPVRNWNAIAGNPNEPGVQFAGWYWDSAFSRKVKWGVDNTTVPASGTSIYAGWKKQEFTVELDFNGGETQARQDTVFWLEYGDLIAAYANAERNFVAYDSLSPTIQQALTEAGKPLYRYHHFIYVDGSDAYSAANQSAYYGSLHKGVTANISSTWSAPKKAYYYESETEKDYWDTHSTDENDKTKTAENLDLTYYDNGLYVKISDIKDALKTKDQTDVEIPGYRLVGWYEVLDKETGKLADYPFDFSTPVKRDITLRAVWIRNGSYSLEYRYQDAEGNNRGFYLTADGSMQIFSGEGSERTYLDASGNATDNPTAARKYADQAMVVMPGAPDSMAKNFIGWRVNGKLYYPGETFHLDSEYDPLIDGLYNQTIILEAVYGVIGKSSITFDGNGGLYAVAGDEYNNPSHTLYGVKENSTVTTPAASDFRRNNHTLIGWARESGATTPEFKPGVEIAISGEMNTLYAVWERTYSVTYFPNLGSGTLTDPEGLVANEDGSYSTLGIKYGDPITLSKGSFVRSGHIQSGWNTKAGGSGTAYTLEGETIESVTDNIELYAQWMPLYFLTFNANRGSGTLLSGGSYVPAGETDQINISVISDGAGNFTTDRIFQSGDKVSLPVEENLSWDGWVFQGWNTKADGTGTLYQPGNEFTVTGNNVLYAKWVKLLTVTYVPNGGSGTLSSGGSYIDSGEALDIAGNVAFNIYSKSAIRLSNGDGFSREGYTLIGWSKDENRTAEDFDPTSNTTKDFALGDPFTMGETDEILYAVWRAKLSVTYNTNGGMGTLGGLAYGGATGVYTTGKVYDIGDSVTLHDGKLTDGASALTKPGYKLMGWNTKDDGTGTHYDLSQTDAFTITENTTLFAEWVKLYSITYDANTGSGTLTNGGSYTYKGGEAVTLTPDAGSVVSDIPIGSTVTLSNGAGFVKYGYAIKAWNIKADGKGQSYNKAATLEMSGNVTLYAIWDTAFTIIFDPHGGAMTGMDDWDQGEAGEGENAYKTYSKTFAKDEKVNKPAAPTKAGGEFAFWSVDPNADPDNELAAYSFPITVEANLTLHAIYRSTAKVTFNVNGGVWTDTREVFDNPSDGVYTTDVRWGKTLADADRKPSNPTYGSYLLLGWTTDSRALGKTDWSTTEFNGSYTNDLGYIQDHLFNLNATPITEDITLYAVWSKTVTVTFDLRQNVDGTQNHTWDGPTNNSYYVRTSTAPLQYVVTLPIGDTVTKPSDPKQSPYIQEVSGFLVWVDQDHEYYHSLAFGDTDYHCYQVWDYLSEITPFDFSTPILSPTTLYTSWKGATYTKYFDVTVTKNRVDTVGVSDATETFPFEYTIKTWYYTRNISGQTTSGPSLLYTTSGTFNLANGKKHTESLSYWSDYNNEDKSRNEYRFYYQTIEFKENVDTDRYTLTITGAGTQGAHTNTRVVDLFTGKTSSTAGYFYYQSNNSSESGWYYGYFWQYNNGNYYFRQGTWYTFDERYYGSDYYKISTATVIDTQTITFKNERIYRPVNIQKVIEKLASESALTAPYGTFRFEVQLTDNGEDVTSALYSKYDSIKREGNASTGYTYYFELQPNTVSGTSVSSSALSLSLPAGSILKVTEVSETGGSGSIFNYKTNATAPGVSGESFKKDGRTFFLTVPTTGTVNVTVTNTEKAKAVPVSLTNRVTDALGASDSFTFTLRLTQGYNDTANPDSVLPHFSVTKGKYVSTTDSDYDTATTTNEAGEITFTASTTDDWATIWTKNLKLPPGAQVIITESGASANNYDTDVSAALAENAGADESFFGSKYANGKTYVAYVPDSGGTITFANTRKNADVVVTKAFEGGTDADNSRTFTFTATLTTADSTAIKSFNVLTGETVTGSGSGVTNEDGAATFTITGADSEILKIPVGAKLVLQETLTGDDTNRYSVSASGARGAWDKDRKTYTASTVALNGDSVTFTNTHNTVTVTVTQTLIDEIMTKSESFGFTVTLTDGTMTGPVDKLDADGNPVVGEDGKTVKVEGEIPRPVTGYTISGANATDDKGQYKFSLGLNGTATLTVPYGATLTVVEDPTESKYLDYAYASPYWTTYKTGAMTDYAPINPLDDAAARSCTFEKLTANAAIDFKNERKIVPVVVKKTVNDPTNTDREFTFEGTVSTMSDVLLANLDLSTGHLKTEESKDENVTNAAGYISFSLKADEGKTLWLPAGVKLDGRETNAGLYDTTISYTGVFMGSNGRYPINWVATYADVLDALKSGKTDDDPTKIADTTGVDYQTKFFPLVTLVGDQKAYTSEIPPWECAIIFTNTKPYVPITVTKVLDDGIGKADDEFFFRVQLYQRSDVEGVLDKETAQGIRYWDYTFDETVTTTNEETGEETTVTKARTVRTNKIQKVTGFVTGEDGKLTASTTFYLPLGAKAVITEIDPSALRNADEIIVTDEDGCYTIQPGKEADANKGDPRYTTTVRHGSNTASRTNAATVDNVSGELDFTFVNTRRTVKVRIVKVNRRGLSLNGASFTVTEGEESKLIGPLSENKSSTVFDGSMYYGSSVTLTETAPTYYTGVGTVTITVSADGKTVEVDGKPVEEGAPGNSAKLDPNTNTWVVKVMNTRNQKHVTVDKTLDDLMLDKESFAFVATLQESDGSGPIGSYPIVEGAVTNDKGEYEFNLADVENGSTASFGLFVPEGATLLVKEKLSDQQANAYTTTAPFPLDKDGENTLYDKPHSAYDEISRTLTLAKVTGDLSLSFTNTRRMVTVDIQKLLDDALDTGDKTFIFKAEIYKDSTEMEPLSNYSVNGFDSGVKDNIHVTSKNGEKKGEQIIVPVDAYLVVTEKLDAAQAKTYDTEIRYNTADSETISDESVTERKLAAPVQVTAQSVLAFTNTRKTVTIKLTKEFRGPASDTEYSFTATVMGETPIPTTLKAYSKYGFASGVMDGIKLKAGDEIDLLVPKGARLSISEAISLDYFVESVTTEREVQNWSFYISTVTFTADMDNTVTFTNAVMPAPTGVDFRIAPFIGLFAFGIALLLLKRRKRDDDDDPDGGGGHSRTTAAEGDSPGEFRNRGDPRAGPPDLGAPFGGAGAERLRGLHRTQHPFRPFGAPPPEGEASAAREIGRRAREKFLSRVILTRIRGWPKARGDPKSIPRARNGPIAEGGIA